MRLPNREERKAFNKANKTHYTLQDFAIMYAINGLQNGEDISWLKPYLPTDMISHKDNWDLFPDGTKVKINYEGVMSRPPKYLSPEFKEWINENKEEVFSIFRDTEDTSRKGLVAVRYLDSSKDTEISKTWLFDLYSDLLAWSDYEGTYVNPQKTEDLLNEIANVKQSLSVYDMANGDSEQKDPAIEKIRECVRLHEDGTTIIFNPVIWQDMDSTILETIEKISENQEEENTEAETVIEAVDEVEKEKEGGEN